MKPIKTIQWLSLVSVLAIGTGPVGAADATATNTVTGVHRSIFILPTSSKDGRDPFFPNSTRTVEIAPTAANNNKEAEITSLKCPGVSGTPDRMLAIINNHSFAVGDEGDVTTSTGKIHLRCLEILSDVVVVEVNGRVHRIKIGVEQ